MKKLKSSLTGFLHSLLFPFGLRLVRIATNKVRGIDPFLDLEWLIGHKSDPVIFDVGANDGETVQSFLKSFPGATIVAFEPFESCHRALKDMFSDRTNVRIENVALGASQGMSQLNVYSGSNMNSLLELDERPENLLKDSFARTGSAPVKVEALDSFCEANGFKTIDVLKIDTQGYDLNVLRGAATLLENKRVKAILLEVNFIPIYKDQPTFQELHAFLTSSGYWLVDFYNHNRHNGYTAWCDACYVAAEIDDCRSSS